MDQEQYHENDQAQDIEADSTLEVLVIQEHVCLETIDEG